MTIPTHLVLCELERARKSRRVFTAYDRSLDSCCIASVIGGSLPVGQFGMFR